jgi:hypothetical protein
VKRLTYLSVHVYVGDEFADAVLRFAAALAREGIAETLEFNAVDEQGEAKHVSFLLGPASSMVIESTTLTLDEPDNREAFEFLRGRMNEHAIARPSTEKPTAESQRRHSTM